MLGGIGRFLSAFGSHSIEVYEWPEATIRKKRLDDGPDWDLLTSKMQPLFFSGWQLAHAVVKADYLVERNYLLPGIGLLLQLDQVLAFDGGSNLRLVNGSPATLNDFTRTSLSGRLGQGLSILFSHSKGYQFAGHLASDPAVQAHLSSGSATTAKAADFLFEKTCGARMILESKASFSQFENDPSKIKSTLKAALTKQVDYWMDKIAPVATDGYAVYSCLREEGDPTPSALIFVDPPSRPGSDPIKIPKDWVRRQNYSAWLRVMGFEVAAENLRHGIRERTVKTEFLVVNAEGREFAVPLHQPGPYYKDSQVVGLEVHVLRSLSGYLSGDTDYLDIEGSDTFPEIDFTEVGAEYRSGSVFPDGSYLGDSRRSYADRFETFPI